MRRAPDVSAAAPKSVASTSSNARVSFAASTTTAGAGAGPESGVNANRTATGVLSAFETLRSVTKRAPNCPEARAAAGMRRLAEAGWAPTNAPSFVESSTGVAHAATRPAPPVTRTSNRSSACGREIRQGRRRR